MPGDVVDDEAQAQGTTPDGEIYLGWTMTVTPPLCSDVNKK